MNGLIKLLEGREEYPPSSELWASILALVKKADNKHNMIIDLQNRMKNEVNRFKVGLPEPEVVKFVFDGNYYYLDSVGNIYEIDAENPLVGNLVGNIVNDASIITVKLNGKIVMQLDKVDIVKEIELHNVKYYVDCENTVYKGFHQKHHLVNKMGKLNANGKLTLIT